MQNVYEIDPAILTGVELDIYVRGHRRGRNKVRRGEGKNTVDFRIMSDIEAAGYIHGYNDAQYTRRIECCSQ